MRTQSLIVKQYKTAQVQMVATLSPNSLTVWLLYYTEKMSILLQLLLHYATVTCQLIFSCILKHQLLMLLGISWRSWYI